MSTTYEKHNYLNPDFPIFFHLDKRKKESEHFHTHWHEHIELLYINSGKCTVCGNGVYVTALPGELVMITPNCIHDIDSTDGDCNYYCITVDKSYCDSMHIPTCGGQFAAKIHDAQAVECFKHIIEIMQVRPKYYQEETKALVLQLMIRCCREAEMLDMQCESTAPCSKMITDAIDYLRAHFNEPVTVEELCLHLGFSKYYFCRKFKAQTGRTVVDYLNFLRCANARRLIASGKYNISESARLSGFNNMSYFSRTYRAQMGSPPSESVKSHNSKASLLQRPHN